MQIKSLLILLITFSFSACIEKYNPQFNDYENLLVVEGMITNEPGPYNVKLSISTSITNPEKRNISDAIVTISDNEGNSEILLEDSPGEYKTAETGIQGIIGRSYKIRIQTVDNVTYESEFQEMLAPTEIKSIYVEKESKFNKQTLNNEAGYQFYVNSKINTPGLLWRAIETYEYNADFLIFYKFQNNQLEVFPNYYALYTCWKTRNINKMLYLKNPSNKSHNIVYPLHYVSAEREKKLHIKYSLLLKGYSISMKESNYWSKIEEINTQDGELFTQQPYQVVGNIKNINNEDIPVLGYFTVAGFSEKRIFVEPILSIYYETNCKADADLFRKILMCGSPNTYYITWDYDGVKGIVGEGCVDCTKKGGVLEKPDFW